MGQTAEQIIQRIDELTDKVNQSYDSKIVSQIHYWQTKLVELEERKPQKYYTKRRTPLVQHYSIVR